MIKLGDILQLKMTTRMHACMHTHIRIRHTHTCNGVSDHSLFRHKTIIRNKFYKKNSRLSWNSYAARKWPKAYLGHLCCEEMAQGLPGTVMLRGSGPRLTWKSYAARKWPKAYLEQLCCEEVAQGLPGTVMLRGSGPRLTWDSYAVRKWPKAYLEQLCCEEMAQGLPGTVML